MAYELTSVDQMYSEAINAIKTIKMSNQRMMGECVPEQEHLIVKQAKSKV